MKAGCNTGSCHGAARGKDGFRLSLFGFDPEGDYHRLLREMPGRRVNLAVPDGQHRPGEGRRPRSRTPAASSSPTDSELYAAAPRVDRRRRPQRRRQDAADGHRRRALPEEGGPRRQGLDPADDRPGHLLRRHRPRRDHARRLPDEQRELGRRRRGRPRHRRRARRGVRHGPVRHLHRRLAVPRPAQGPGIHLPRRARGQLRRHARRRQAEEDPGRPLGPLLRRGLPPPGLPSTSSACCRPPRSTAPSWPTPTPTSGPRSIDELLEPQGVLRDLGPEVGRAAPGPDGARTGSTTRGCTSITTGSSSSSPTTCRWTRWPATSSAASGGTFQDPATNFYQGTDDKLLLAENVAQVFMGMRIQCAQCHNHPFDRWTQDDYYGFVAFFAQIGKKRGDDYRETIIFNSGGGETKHPVDGRVMPPKFLGGEAPDVAGKDRREVLAEWLASPQQPLLRHQLRQPGLGPLLRHRHRRAGRRLPRQQPGLEPRAARRAGQAVHRVRLRPQVAGPRHLQQPDLPARHRRATSRTPTTRSTSPTPTSGGSRPRPCWT